jgi:hypothetical protein
MCNVCVYRVEWESCRVYFLAKNGMLRASHVDHNSLQDYPNFKVDQVLEIHNSCGKRTQTIEVLTGLEWLEQ